MYFRSKIFLRFSCILDEKLSQGTHVDFVLYFSLCLIWDCTSLNEGMARNQEDYRDSGKVRVRPLYKGSIGNGRWV